MAHEGTVINGVIVLDGRARLPEGERVRVELADGDDLAPPPEPYDRAKELAILREALEDVKAGRGRPFEEFMAELAEEHKRPYPPSAGEHRNEYSLRSRADSVLARPQL